MAMTHRPFLRDARKKNESYGGAVYVSSVLAGTRNVAAKSSRRWRAGREEFGGSECHLIFSVNSFVLRTAMLRYLVVRGDNKNAQTK